jgi:hypothetical protein
VKQRPSGFEKSMRRPGNGLASPNNRVLERTTGGKSLPALPYFARE